MFPRRERWYGGDKTIAPVPKGFIICIKPFGKTAFRHFYHLSPFRGHEDYFIVIAFYVILSMRCNAPHFSQGSLLRVWLCLGFPDGQSKYLFVILRFARRERQSKDLKIVV